MPTAPPPTPVASQRLHTKQQLRRKRGKINTPRNITYYIPAITSKPEGTQTPLCPSITSPFVTNTTIFSESQNQKLPYTFCIQCEKPIYELVWKFVTSITVSCPRELWSVVSSRSHMAYYIPNCDKRRLHRNWHWRSLYQEQTTRSLQRSDKNKLWPHVDCNMEGGYQDELGLAGTQMSES